MKIEGKQTWWLKWLAILLGIGLVLLWDFAGEPGRPSTLLPMTRPILAEDVVQERLNAVPPAPHGDVQLTYQFVAQHNGLSEVELLLARNGEPNADENGRFTLTLFDEQNNQLAIRSLPTRQLTHNQPFVLRFPSQPNSGGRPYTLTLSGSSDNRVSVWGYSVDLLEDTELSVISGPLRTESPETAVQELRFTSRYQLTAAEALKNLGQLLRQNGWLILLILLFLPLPGMLLLKLRPFPALTDPMAKAGVMLALGTAVWPIVWYLISLVGGRLSSGLLWLLLVGGWLLIIFQRKGAKTQRRLTSFRQGWHVEHTTLIILLLVGLSVRLLAVRDLTFPPWVDSVRHGLITAVMSQSGQTITQTGYEPYLTVSRFPYHFGFHTLSSSLVWLSGWEIPRLLLGLGQLLNSLVPLTMYAGGWLLTRQRRAGLLAAFLVAIPLFFPAYYATWGRYTQLTAVLLLPILLGLTWQLVRGTKQWRTVWWQITLLATGLFLIHFRVFVFFLPFAGLVWLVSRGRNGRFLTMATGGSLLLLAPQIIYLWQIANPGQALAARLPSYTAFPTAYYTAGWDRLFLWLAGGLLGVVLLLWLGRRRRWTAVPLLVAAWAGLVLLLLSGDYLGFAALPLLNLNSYYITTFLPLALLLGSVGAAGWRWQRQLTPPLAFSGLLSWSMVGTVVTLFGIQQQITIINEQTVLTQPADVAALAWLDEHLPEAATVAVSSWRWLINTWSGNDGGAWMVPLTGRQSSTPPADYTYSRELFNEVFLFNQAAMSVTDWSTPETADWLRGQGITHIFVGVNGDMFDPAELLKNPRLELLYGRNGAFIFKLRANSPSYLNFVPIRIQTIKR